MLETLAADLCAHGLHDEAKAVLEKPKPVLYTHVEAESDLRVNSASARHLPSSPASKQLVEHRKT